MYALAITATEMRFRPFAYRVAEYLYVLILLLLAKDASKVSVGISQVSIRHYMELRGVSQFGSLRLALSGRNNLKICCEIIDNKSITSLSDLSVSYNGHSTRFYRKLLERNHSIFNSDKARN